MTNKLQIQSIHILNSKYCILFTLGIYFIIYLFFYSDSITLCMKSNPIPIIAESKDEIIRNLQKQVNDLTIEKDFLRKNVTNIMRESYDVKQQHLNQMRKLEEEVFDLRFRSLRSYQTIQDFNVPSIPHAEVVAEATDVAHLLAPLKEENTLLQEQVKKTLEDNATLRANLDHAIASIREVESDSERYIQQLHKISSEKKTLLQRLRIAETKPVLEDKEVQTESPIVEKRVGRDRPDDRGRFDSSLTDFFPRSVSKPVPIEKIELPKKEATSEPSKTSFEDHIPSYYRIGRNGLEQVLDYGRSNYNSDSD